MLRYVIALKYLILMLYISIALKCQNEIILFLDDFILGVKEFETSNLYAYLSFK